ncbi:MAG: hypothetical protein GEV10_03210 [Streptosporangiales bacterium]|nr:hypothetical protein [Streptosporangiales bacterium]
MTEEQGRGTQPPEHGRPDAEADDADTGHTARDVPGAERSRRRRSNEAPFEKDGRCSRCGGRWPCLHCLTSTPPYVRVMNNL